MSDLLNSASLVMIPSGYKEDTVYSVVPSDGSGDMSFTRSSNGTRINSAGLVEVCPWNMVEYSENFTNAYWTKNRSSVTADSTTAPNGTATADSLIEDTANGTHEFIRVISVELQTYSLSIYAKANTRTKIQLVLAGSPWATGGNGEASFDLTLGTVISAVNGATATIESVGNGWYRCKITKITSAADPSGVIAVRLLDASGNASYTGNGTSGAYYYGAQLNIGAIKPYFPTTDRLNVPRLTYQNGGGGCPSLLLEKQSTNLMWPSEDFTNANWILQNATITANNTTSPDGTQNADKITTTSIISENYVRISNISILANIGSSYTTTIFAKKGTGNFLRIRNLFVTNGATGGNAYFNLNTGAVGTVQNSQIASIQDMGNGWYRCSLTGVVGVVNAFSLIDFGFTNADNTNFPSSNVNGYIWGAQLEASSYPTSYIPTTSSSATRVADECRKSGIGALIGGTSGTVFFDIKTNPVLSASQYKQFCYYVTSGGSQSYLYLDGSNKITTNATWGSLFFSTTAFQPNTRYKVALVFAPNDFALYINGVSVATASSGTPNNNVDLQIGQFNGTQMCEFVFNQYTHFPSRLTNAELASLTTL